MKDPDDEVPATAAELRAVAEASLRRISGAAAEDLDTLSPRAMRRVVHELRVHQIELEMQNEELRKAHAELAISRQRYLDLYDLAPVAYLTLSPEGRIQQANLTAATLLGSNRSALIGRHLSSFIFRADQDLFYLYRKQFLASEEPQHRELRMVKPGATVFWARLMCSTACDSHGTDVCHCMIGDITHQRQLEKSMRMKDRVFEASITANSIATPEGIVSEANDGFLRLWGFPRKADVVGHPIGHFFQDSNEAAAILAALDSVDRWEGEFTAKKRDGSSFLAYGQATVVRDETGKAIGYQSSVSDVTEQRRVHLNLRKSEALLNAIQHLSRVGGWLWDIAQQRMHWTEETYRIHGYTADQIGSAMDEHLTKSLGLCDESVRSTLLAAFLRCAEHGEAYDIEYPFTNASGQRLWLRTTAHAVWDGPCIAQVVGNIIDITERKQAELALREWNAALEQRVAGRTLELKDSEIRFRQLAEATCEGIAVCRDGIMLDGNRRFAQMHGYELAEMLGRPLMEFVAPQSRHSVKKSADDSAATTHEVFGLSKDGTIFPAEARTWIGPWQGNTGRFITLRDLSEANELEAKVHSLRAELVRSQRLALVSEVSAGIIHQISQPISSIGTNLAVLLKLKSAELRHCGAMEIISDVEVDVSRMRDMVSHLRAIANPGHATLASTNLNALATEVLPLLRSQADYAQVRVELDLHQPLPAIQGDEIQLSQVIFNLTRNAIEATVDVPPERRMVLITTRPLGEQRVELCVRDQGCGLSPETLDGLFTPFFSTKSNGMGVGLRLSQTIVQTHGGTIEGGNNPGGIGTTFRIILPTMPVP